MQSRVMKTQRVGFPETPFSSIPWPGTAPLWPVAPREEMQSTESALSAYRVAHMKTTRRSLGCASSVSSVCLIWAFVALSGWWALRHLEENCS